jgi:addiction module HigA family antidote
MSRPNRDPNRRPTHPGALLLQDVLPDLAISQDQFARRLGVSRVTVSQLLNEHRALSAAMAVRLEQVLGGRAEFWLAMQQAVDLWEARRGFRDPAFVLPEADTEPTFTAAQDAAASVIDRARFGPRSAYTSGKSVGNRGAIEQEGSTWTDAGVGT